MHPKPQAVVTEEAPGFDKSVLDSLLQLVERQRRLEDFRTRAESRRDAVTTAVYERVMADYQSRLDALRVEAAPLKGRVRAEYQKLRGVAERLRERLDGARLDKEELEFRRDVGELDDAEFARRVDAPSATLQQCQSELDALDAQGARFLEALGPDDETAEEPAPATEDSQATMISAPEGLSPPSFAVPAAATSHPDSGVTVIMPDARLVLDENGSLTEFRLSASNNIGRTMDNQVQLVCAGVSRRHAQIALGADRQYVIKDLQSQNGTFVNGEKITTARLADGDHIKIGEANLTFHSPNTSA